MARIERISNPDDLETAWSQQYTQLSHHFSRLIPRRGTLVEIGCGKGQLTIPLAVKRPQLQIIGVDNFRRPYSKSHAQLLSTIAARGMKIRIKVVVSDYQAWLTRQPDSSYDSIISSEFLPEIDSKNMRDLLGECYRVLKPGGNTIHSFLAPKPRNAKQRRVIEADSDPRWTKTPPVEWFSPAPEVVMNDLNRAGFKILPMVRLRSGLVIRSDAARELLNGWDVRDSYWKANRAILEKEGLEIPDWLIFTGTKRPS